MVYIVMEELKLEYEQLSAKYKDLKTIYKGIEDITFKNKETRKKQKILGQQMYAMNLKIITLLQKMSGINLI